MTMSISGWTLLPDRGYERPLGTLESVFYWFSAFSRTTDIIRCAQVNVVAGHLDEIINLPNVTQAWTNVKKLFPSLGARLYERDNVFLNVDYSPANRTKFRFMKYRPVRMPCAWRIVCWKWTDFPMTYWRTLS